MGKIKWAAGVDLGGTKIKVMQVNALGTIGEQIQYPTDVNGGPDSIQKEIIDAIKHLTKKIGCEPSAVGVGVAGQIENNSGLVKFAPNLKWKDIPLQQNLVSTLDLPVVVINDVRAATYGEWLHGAGKGCEELICIFIGTGIGGGIVSSGKMLSGFNNTAGEIGHMTVAIDGPLCSCGNFGCVEAYAGGWALAKRAIEAIESGEKSELLIKKAGGHLQGIKGYHVMEGAKEGDPLSKIVVDHAVVALGAAVASLINIVSPKTLIFGGGVIDGSPYLIRLIAEEAKRRALTAALEKVCMKSGSLLNDAGAIGAGALAVQMFIKSGSHSNLD